MDAERIFFQAKEIGDPEVRLAFIEGACQGDASKRAAVGALLAARVGGTELNGASHRVDPAETVEVASFSEAPGTVIGRYKILEKIGEGGMAVVYVAEQHRPIRRRVALKIIKPGMDTRQVIARFEAERQALALMDHPNIARALDAGATDTGRPYFVMELVRGIPVTQYCDHEKLRTRDRLDLFIQVCHAIQHAHQKGVIHRDIKPSNVMVTLHDGVAVPKVIDFGIAKATQQELTEKTVYTQFQQFIGTPAYMSPEQAEMSGLDIDTRSDIYSLGVLLYELLTGSTPFDTHELMRSGVDQMRKIICEREPYRPSTKVGTLSAEDRTTTALRQSTEVPKLISVLRGDLDWIAMKCLEKDRTRRYDTADALAMDIQRHLNNEPVMARPPSAIYRFQKAWRRNKVVCTAGAAVISALVIGIGLSLWQAQVARQEKEAADLARHEADGLRIQAVAQAQAAKEAQELAEKNQQLATASAAQAALNLYAADMSLAQQALKVNNLGKAIRLLDRHRPQAGGDDLRGWEWRYLWQQTRSTALATLTNRPTRGFDVSFSPEGTRLAVGWYDGRVEVWDVPNRRLISSLVSGEHSRFGHVVFSPVRNLLAATSHPNTVTFYDLDSGQQSTALEITDEGSWIVQDLSFSSDGSRLVIYASGPSLVAGDAVWLVDVDSRSIEGRYRTLRSGSQFHGAARLSPDNRRLYLSQSDFRKYSYTIGCMDLTTREQLWQTEPQGDYGLTALALSPDGSVLASGSGFEDDTIRIWDTQSGRLLLRLQGHTGWVGKLVFTHDGRHLISASTDQTIRVWDTGAWTETSVLRGHNDEVHAVAVSDPAGLIASTGRDGNLMLWHAEEKAKAGGYFAIPDPYKNVQVIPLGESRFLLPPSRQIAGLSDLTEGVSPAALPELTDGARLLGFFGTNTLCYWDGTHQIRATELHGTELVQCGAIELKPGVAPSALTFNAEHQLIAWTEVDSGRAVYVANLNTPGVRTELASDLTRVSRLLMSADGGLLAATAPAGVRVWHIQTGRILLSIDESVSQVVLAAGGRGLVTLTASNVDHEIRFYDLTDTRCEPRRFPGRDRSRSLAVSPDGRLIAASTDTGRLLLFDAVKGQLIESIRGHLNALFDVAFSPDGKRLISSGGGPEAVKVWDVKTRQELLTLAGVGSFLPQAAWSPDGNEIIASRPLQVWRAPSWEEIAAAEAKESAEGRHL